MKSFICFIFILFSINGLSVHAEVVESKLLVIFDLRDKGDFDLKVAPILENEFKKCKNCQFLNLSPYDENGHFKIDQLVDNFKKVPNSANILLFNWNEKSTEKNESIRNYINQELQKYTMVSAAGEPKEKDPSLPLSNTLFGKIKNMIIIGELGEKDRLIGASYFGPEMLTALRPPKEYIGERLAPVLFAAHMLINYEKSNDWQVYLQSKKSKTRKIWLELRDIF